LAEPGGPDRGLCAYGACQSRPAQSTRLAPVPGGNPTSGGFPRGRARPGLVPSARGDPDMSNSATKRGKVISDAEFERLWSDYSLTCAQIGAWLGIARQSVSTRARRRGLPPRPQGRRVPAYDGALFGRMVSAGVRQADI